ncbi:alpha/beta fold hydrolase [Actinophytocola sp.]|uniref:alpha/beta fold hydrolase n=1 Tax=Actinophytocola sp. TaxID=1872138 RepID=UPI0039C8BBFB
MGRRWVWAGGVRLAVYEEGVEGGPTVLLVHGYPDNASVWDGVVGHLGERFRVVRYDVRGCGGSGAPRGRDGYHLSRLVDDLVSVVRAVGGPVHLVGHDWGSIQGWAAIAKHSESFASFTSISGPDLGHLKVWVRRGPLLDVVRQMPHTWYIAAFQVPLLPELVWRLPALRRRFQAEYRDARAGLGLYRANMFSPRGNPRRVSVPVQQIALTRDPYVSGAMLTAADPWCERLLRRPLDGGHWAVRDRSGAVARLVAEFVDAVTTESGSRRL